MKYVGMIQNTINMETNEIATVVITILAISFIISLLAIYLAKKQWAIFGEMKVGDTVSFEGSSAEILEKDESGAVIKVRVSGSKLSKIKQ